jgi:hypothetical protein
VRTLALAGVRRMRALRVQDRFLVSGLGCSVHATYVYLVWFQAGGPDAFVTLLDVYRGASLI